MSYQHLSCPSLSIDVSRFGQDILHYESPHKKTALDKFNQWLDGHSVNDTENRPAMHMALRAHARDPWPSDMISAVLQTRDTIKEFTQNCAAKHIVHIGIGGSDFGPRLIVDALRPTTPALRDIRFLSTLTPDIIKATLDDLDLSQTCFVIASKSFTTDETLFLLNCLITHYGVKSDHIIALTAAPAKAKAHGIADHHIFPLWDWVGGRFSLWSSVGLSIALVYGYEIFERLLNGARAVDLDLHDTKDQSAAWRLAQILGAERLINQRHALALLPYDARLTLLPAYAQQLLMESNGKNTQANSASLVIGQTGTEFQHSFGQYLHQGPDICVSAFITINDTFYEKDWMNKARHLLNINAIAQADTLWQGRYHKEPHRHLAGQRPSCVISMPSMGAYDLGALLAFLEHVTVCDAFLNGLNPFDQWGVEAGKMLAKERLHKD